ncbi:hypothetical protein V5740_07485 [Croceibacterium sp. TMG7-5b_MA50]|uniref:hypothetical protein n=1 Tax=Croceibacterium sp. TMG7-5b_MA50 TaxID=3121290 RepID=UPI003221BCBA
MHSITKGLIGSAAAGAMALGSIAPAQAQGYRYRDRDNGISAGEIIAGALIIGGIAAVASAASRDNRRGGYYDDRYYNDGYYGYNPRDAVEQCVAVAERTASRYSYGGRSEVTDIRDIDRNRNGYRIRGRIAVNQMDRGWRRGDPRYGRGWNNDYRGWNDNYRGWDAGNFTCRIDWGRVVDIDYSGIRGL